LSKTGPLTRDEILQTHGDILSTLNSKPLYNKINAVAIAPGANQPLTVTGGNSSTSNVNTDGQRKIVGRVPGTSIAIQNPA
jgi:hypothetical protein